MTNPRTLTARPWPALRSHGAAAAVLALLVVVYAWPLLARLTVALPGTARDHDVATFAWNVSHVRQALEAGAGLLHTERVLAPHGADLRLHTYGLLQGLLAYPLTKLVGDLGAFNLVVVATIWLNAAGLYALAYVETRSRWAALVAGLAGALSGPILSQARVGRPSFGSLWITCAALLALRAMLNRPRLETGALLGLTLVAALLTDFQILYFTVLWLGLYALYRWRRDGQRLLTGPHLAAGAVAALLVAAPFLAIYYPVLADEATYVPMFADMQVYSFALRDFFRFGVVPIYSSYVIMAGALAAVLLLRGRGAYRFWLAAALVFFMLALGPYLQPTRLPLPTALAGTLWPPLRQFRTPGRMTMPAQLGLAMAGAVALAHVKSRPWAWAVGGVALAGALGYALWREPLTVQVYPRYAVYDRIGAEPGDFALLEVPVGVRTGFQRLGAGGEVLQLYQAQHGKRLINGMIARLPAGVFEQLAAHCALRFLSGDLAAAEGCALADDFQAVAAEIGARYVLVHRGRLSAEQAAAIEAFLTAQAGLVLDTVEADLAVYRWRTSAGTE